MSNNILSTKDKIVAKAIEMYNIYGIEYVGVRELAKELDMKGGNITYYFPTKDDLVVEISHRLSVVNKDLLTSTEHLSLQNLLQVYREIYANQYGFRSIMISLPHLLKQNEKFAKNYKRNQAERKDTMQKQVDGLISGGFIKKLKGDEITALQSIMAYNNRFWLSEAMVDNRIGSESQAVSFALTKFIGIMRLVVTEKGKKEIAAFMQQ